MKKGINNSGFRALPSSVQNNILSNMKYGGRNFAAGGAMPMEQLTEFNEGGRHEESSLGGIPQGINPQGQMNLVEEGETKFDAENYIYSDSLKVDKELAEAFNLAPSMVGKTFADASKMAGRKKSKREGDAIEMAANEKDLMNLMEAQEAFKQARIEEKLQEIAELDPNALPALMGQGQPQGGPQEGAPQGDPAMGGQMQEAPMDEQAMMEQQMMAEQQGGGGQPSPEEMAMMEQQQNMAMGQQEGMMRNGGYTTRSYAPGGFMGANPGMMNMANAGAMGVSGDPLGCKCANGSTSQTCCGQNYAEEGEGVNKEKYDADGNKIPFFQRHAHFRGSNRKLPFWHRQALKKNNVNYRQQVTGTDGGTDHSLMKDSNMSQNYANIDMSQYTPEEQEAMTGYFWAHEPAMWEKLNPGILNKKDSKQIKRVNAALDWTPPSISANFNKIKKNRPGDSPNKIPFFNRDDIREFKGEFPKVKSQNHDVFSDIFLDGKRTGDGEIQTPWKNMPWRHKRIRETEDADGNTLRRLSNLFLGVKGQDTKRSYLNPFNEDARFARQQRRANRNEFGGSLMQPVQGTGMNQPGMNMAQPGFNQNMVQPMNQMRRGGKMCYGCGGAMHAYGGRMNGIQGDPAKYGKWLDIGSKALGVTGNIVGTAVPWAGAAIGGFAGGMESLSDNAAASDDGSVDWRGIDWADMAKDVGVGAASGAMGAAGAGAKLALSTGDQLADSLYENKYEKQEADHLAILNDPNADPDSLEYINAVNKEKERIKNQGAFGIAGQAIGAAGSILSGKIGDVAEDAPGAVIDSGIDTIPNEDIIPEMNFSKYGGNLMRGGGRLYNTGGYMSPMFAGPEGNDLDLETTNDDGTYGGDIDNAFIDMSMSANPTDLISPAYNLGMGLFGKSADTAYNIEPYTFKPFDFTETKNALRRQTAKAINQLGRKSTGNPSNLLALSQIGSKLEADYLQKAQNINIKREQAAMDKNTKAKNAYEKEQKELELKEKAIRDELIKAGLKDIRGISDKNAQTEYMFKFMQSMAPDVVKGSYKNMSQMFMEMFKKKQKKSK